MGDLQTINEEVTEIVEQDGTVQLLTFMLAGEEYGVDILRVQEIRGWSTITPIPHTPDYLKGVINLRGTIVPLIDLRERFGLEVLEYGPTTVMIIVKVAAEGRERVMGIVVDAVSEVYNVSPDDLQPPPDFGGVVSVEFVKGLTSVADKMVIFLDIDRLLNTAEFAVLEQAASMTE